MEAPEFDPAQPFESMTTAAPAAPEFDPSQPFEPAPAPSAAPQRGIFGRVTDQVLGGNPLTAALSEQGQEAGTAVAESLRSQTESALKGYGAGYTQLAREQGSTLQRPMVPGPDATPAELAAYRQRRFVRGERMTPETEEARRQQWSEQGARPVTEHPLYQAGEWVGNIGKSSEGTDYLGPGPGWQGSWTRDIAGGATSILTNIAFSRINPALAPLWYVPGGAGEQLDRAIKSGATEEQAIAAAGTGAAAATTNMVDTLLPTFGGSTGKLMGFLNKVGVDKVARIFAGGSAEAIQEGVEGLINNAYAQGTYNPEQDVMENIPRSMAVAFIVGAGTTAGFTGGKPAAAQPLEGEVIPPAPPLPTSPMLPRPSAGAETALLPPEYGHTGTRGPEYWGRASAGAAATPGGALADTLPETRALLKKLAATEGWNESVIENIIEGMSPHEFLAEASDNFALTTSGLRRTAGGNWVNDIVGSFRTRGLEAPDRMRAIFDTAFGEKQNTFEYQKLLELQRNQVSSPYWETFKNTPIPPTPALAELRDALEASGAWAKAETNLRIGRIPRENQFLYIPSGAPGQPGQHIALSNNITTQGEAPTIKVPSAAFYQAVKESLDDRITAAIAKPEGANEVRLLTELKQALINAIDNHPDSRVAGLWRQAREVYAAPSQLMAAQKLGQRVLTGHIDPDDYPFLTASFSPMELRALDIGVRKYLERMLGGRGKKENTTINEILAPNNQEKLRWQLGDERADRLIAAIEAERRMHFSPGTIIHGSATAQNISAQQMFEPKAGWIAELEAKDLPHGLTHLASMAAAKVARFGQAKLKAAAEAKQRQVNEEAARLLTLQGPDRDAVMRWMASGGEETEGGPAPTRPPPGTPGTPGTEGGALPTGFDQPPTRLQPKITATTLRLEEKAKDNPRRVVDLGPLNLNPELPLGSQTQNYVLERGRATGVEHIVAFDGDGNVVANGHGARDFVGLSPDLERAIKNPDGMVTVHHNHPSNTPLGTGDLSMLGYPGLASLWAHGHGGSVSHASLTPNARSAMPESFTTSAILMYNTVKKVGDDIFPALQRAVNDKSLTVNEATVAHYALIGETLRHAGVLDYQSNVEVDPIVARLKLEPIIEKAAKSAEGSIFNGKRDTTNRDDRRTESVRQPGDMGVSFDGLAEDAGQYGPPSTDDRSGRKDDQEKGSLQPSVKNIARQLTAAGTDRQAFNQIFAALDGLSKTDLLSIANDYTGLSNLNRLSAADLKREIGKSFIRNARFQNKIAPTPHPAPEPPSATATAVDEAITAIDAFLNAKRDADSLQRKVLERGRSGRPIRTEPLAIGKEQDILEAGYKRSVAPPFYSSIAKAIDTIKQEKAPAQQWLGMLKNKQGVKPEEMEWLGLESWLKEQTGPVTKAQVQEFIRENQIEVKEVSKGGGRPIAEIDREMDALYRELTPRRPHFSQHPELNARLQALQAERNAVQNSIKFSSYQLPGGENYRELLLTLPPSKLSPDAAGKNLYDNFVRRGGGQTWEQLAPETRQHWTERAVEQGQGLDYNTDKMYRSSHWDEPNVLAHIRFNDRVIDGKKTLFIEEIQSDWHQAGKRKEYKTPEVAAETKARRDRIGEINDLMEAFGKDRLPNNQMRNEKGWHALANERDALYRAQSAAEGMVPDAPFKTTWPELSLKRMIRYAAENGYEKVAWTPGKVQAERYDLSKQVESIDYARNGTQTALNIFTKPNGERIGKVAKTDDELADLVGKEVADKIIKGEGLSNSAPEHNVTQGTLSNLALRVGGEGMSGFYDKILPAAANKLVKKYGARIGEGDVVELPGWPANEAEGVRGAKDRSQRVHTLDITPALRKAALVSGFPQFSSGGAVYRANGGRVVASNVDPNPTEAQKEAGNYAKDHVNIHGLDITIENAKGHERKGVDKGGKSWSVTMPAHYGYIKGTVGKDKDHVDVYVGPHQKSPHVFVVDQMNADTKRFDEHKCFVGFASKAQVASTYRKAFSDGRADERLGHMHEMSVGEFKRWLENGDTTKPVQVDAETAKLPHLAVGYIDPSRIKTERCGNCAMFIMPAHGGPACTLVKSPIAGTAWCRRYSARGSSK